MKKNTPDLAMPDLAAAACGEIAAVFDRMAPDTASPLVDAIRAARRIALYGVGREGLMMKAFAMRLYHLGLDAHVVGDMTTPPLGKGDLLIVSAGPGGFSTVSGLVGVARDAGARTLCITAQTDGETVRLADRAIRLPAQTMADDTAPQSASILPMGSLYEGVQYVFFEIVVLMLRAAMGVSPDAMRANHTNLE
ncbi:MAG: SIS domain-containing protein [Inquilinaceae bacterium]